MVKMLKSKAIEVIGDPESESEVVKLRTQVVTELVSQQEEIFSQPMKVVELPIETHVDPVAEPILKIVSSLAVMRASIFLRSPDIYDPLWIFLHEPVSQEIGTLICEIDVSGAELTCHAACILLELPSMATRISKACSISTTWSRRDVPVLLPRPPPWPD